MAFASDSILQGSQKLVTFARATGSSALSESITLLEPSMLREMMLHITGLPSGGTSGTLTITLDSNAGAGYDTVLLSQDMSSVSSSLHWQATHPIRLDKGDVISLVWANGDACTYGITVVYEGL